MAVTDRLSTAIVTTRPDVNRLLYVAILVPTLLGVAHHVDHIIRGNHVGWPLTAHVNPFTYSLVIYPLLAIGLYLMVTERVGAGFWSGFLAFSTAMLAYFHISPWAVEPPTDVIHPYANPLHGYVAFAVLLTLIGSVCLGSVYATVLWYRRRR